MNRSELPELLSPVGDWEMCKAAVHNGADAIYLGMPGFNARGRAKTFSKEELKEIIDYCHLYGVKVFLAFNVLIFERELEQCASLLEEVLPLSPDAFIVQDIGLLRLIKKMAPWVDLHGSTQMTITNYEALELLRDLEMKRVVLGREVSIPEILKIREHTKTELEVFVHGALCVAYSGQCLTSESLGGRSANRGQCAQVCRLDYELIVDGHPRDLGDKRFLVSPKDLCGLEEIQKLKEIGVDSFKIEGRLKSPEYVASTTSRYRKEIDREKTPCSKLERSEAIDQLKLNFSRDFYSGWLHGVNHQNLVDARYSSHHGIEVGEIIEVRDRSIIISSTFSVSAGDGVLFTTFEQSSERGAKVFQVQAIGDARFELYFSNEFNLNSLTPGMRVFVNSSDRLSKTLTQSFTAKERLKRIPLKACVQGEIGGSLKLSYQDSLGNLTQVSSAKLLEQAKSSPVTIESVKDEIGALGGTCFILTDLQYELPPNVFIDNRELKNLRREAVAKLEQLRQAGRSAPISSATQVIEWAKSQSRPERNRLAKQSPVLHLLLRDISQIEALQDLPLGTIYLDFEFGKEYAEALKEIRSLGLCVGIATTRILKPGEIGHLKVIDRLGPDSVLIRNPGALHFFKDSSFELVGDFSLNITNSLSASWYKEKGLKRLTPSYDLNKEQLFELIQSSPSIGYEVTVHQYMPEFHMEHCVYAAFLSSGTSFRDCGRPCEKHRVEMRDLDGVLHPLKPDAECRNTMFNGKPQSAARLISPLLENSVRDFRLEALFESASELRKKIEIYLDLLKGEDAPARTLEKLGVVEKYGVTEGQLYNIRTWNDRKKCA